MQCFWVYLVEYVSYQPTPERITGRAVVEARDAEAAREEAKRLWPRAYRESDLVVPVAEPFQEVKHA